MSFADLRLRFVDSANVAARRPSAAYKSAASVIFFAFIAAKCFPMVATSPRANGPVSASAGLCRAKVGGRAREKWRENLSRPPLC